MAERKVGVGARQDQQDSGLAAEGAPGFGAVEQPAAFGFGGFQAHVGDIGAVVRLGHRHRAQQLAGGQLRQPFVLLLLGAALEQRLGQDFRTGDETARRAQRTARQFLGHHDHAEVVFLFVALDAAETFGNGDAEAAHVLDLIQNGIGNVEVVAVDFLGQRHHHFLGDPAELLAHHFVMVVQQIRPGHAVLRPHQLAQFGHSRRRQLGDAELADFRIIHGLAQPSVVQTKIGRPGAQAVAHRLQGFGGEQQREAFL